MPWIKTVPYEDADPILKRVYDKVKSRDGQIDNVLSIHSLRPHSLVGHMALYKNVLHNSNNTLPKSYLEALGVYVSYLNKCDYCVHHHFEGFKKLIGNDEKALQLMEGIEKGELEVYFDKKQLHGASYARMLTLDHSNITASNIDRLREVGFSDGEILEINQVCCYFNYVNRMVVGLGVTIDGEVLGLSPNDSSDMDNWSHR